MPRVT